jgi:hypothetical protein
MKQITMIIANEMFLKKHMEWKYSGSAKLANLER